MGEPVVWGFKAIKPFRAEHPVGSGTMVDYAAGDEVPAAEWGRAEAFMVEAGTIMRYARDVATVPGQTTSWPAHQLDAPVPVPREAPPASPAPAPLQTQDEADAEAAEAAAAPTEEAAPEEPPEVEVPDDATFPHNAGGGWFVLSDGAKVKGKTKAMAAQAELDVAAENSAETA